MKIITTPMCEEIVKLAGVKEYTINKHPDNEKGDFAVSLSESNVKMPHLSVKINTPSQVFQSIKEVSKITDHELTDEEILIFFKDYKYCKKYLNSDFKQDINVKVYSNFLKDIVEDVGFNIVDKNFEYVIFPDYLKNEVIENGNLVEIPSHNSISKNPFEKIELRYEILETLI